MRPDDLPIARAFRYVLGPAALIMLAGCATLTIVPAERLEGQRLTPTAEPMAHIYAANWGIYLFKYLPLVTGSLSRPGVPSWPALFSDEVQIELLAQNERGKQATGRNGTDGPSNPGPIVLVGLDLDSLAERVRGLGELVAVALGKRTRVRVSGSA